MFKRPVPVPPVRVDRDYLLKQEYYLAQQVLLIAAVLVNSIAKGGTIYPNVILPPEVMARKKSLMEEG